MHTLSWRTTGRGAETGKCGGGGGMSFSSAHLPLRLSCCGPSPSCQPEAACFMGTPVALSSLMHPPTLEGQEVGVHVLTHSCARTFSPDSELGPLGSAFHAGIIYRPRSSLVPGRIPSLDSLSLPLCTSVPGFPDVHLLPSTWVPPWPPTPQRCPAPLFIPSSIPTPKSPPSVLPIPPWSPLHPLTSTLGSRIRHNHCFFPAPTAVRSHLCFPSAAPGKSLASRLVGNTGLTVFRGVTTVDLRASCAVPPADLLVKRPLSPTRTLFCCPLSSPHGQCDPFLLPAEATRTGQPPPMAPRSALLLPSLLSTPFPHITQLWAVPSAPKHILTLKQRRKPALSPLLCLVLPVSVPLYDRIFPSWLRSRLSATLCTQGEQRVPHGDPYPEGSGWGQRGRGGVRRGLHLARHGRAGPLLPSGWVTLHVLFFFFNN